MEDHRLEPWMLRADWRHDRRPMVVVDLAEWPADMPLDLLPPVPVIAVGDRAHPAAHSADVLVEPPITLAGLATAIEARPHASATLVQLLRAIEGLPANRALSLESFAFAMLQAGSEHAAWLGAQSAADPLPGGTLHVTRIGNLLNLLIDRPHARNAIDRAMRDALHEACTLADLDPSLARVRIRAAGPCFSMGADLVEFGTTRDPVEAHAIRARTLPAHAMARRGAIYDIHVNGGCVGSALELAAFAGALTASPDAWFQLPEVAMGILPGFGGCVSIPQRIGRQRATALMLSGRRINASTALGWGLVDALVNEPPVDQCRTDTIGR